jgi:hypothetical protein
MHSFSINWLPHGSYVLQGWLSREMAPNGAPCESGTDGVTAAAPAANLPRMRAEHSLLQATACIGR